MAALDDDEKTLHSMKGIRGGRLNFPFKSELYALIFKNRMPAS